MPNHCENELTITGPFYDLVKLRIKAVGFSPQWGDPPSWDKGDIEKEELCCDNFIPIPKKVLKSFDKYGYSWSIENWGSKWGAYNVEIAEHYHFPITSKNKRLFYFFTTAWSPIPSVILEMSKQFPSLNFSYRFWEGGVGFKGKLICKGGRIVNQDESKYCGDRGG